MTVSDALSEIEQVSQFRKATDRKQTSSQEALTTREELRMVNEQQQRNEWAQLAIDALDISPKARIIIKMIERVVKTEQDYHHLSAMLTINSTKANPQSLFSILCQMERDPERMAIREAWELTGIADQLLIEQGRVKA